MLFLNFFLYTGLYSDLEPLYQYDEVLLALADIQEVQLLNSLES
jgi:hypothetical protein